VKSVSVAPPSATLTVGASLQLAAVARDADDNPLSDRTTEWKSANERIATVSQAGLVVAVSAGTVVVSAVVEGVAGTASITVVAPPDPEPPPVHTVSVAPGSGSILVGASLQLAATMFDAQGNVLGGRPVEWRSSDPAIAVVSATGLVTGKAPGAATITATSEGRSGAARITVTAPPPPPPPPAPVRSVTVTPSAAVLFVGKTLALTATLRDAEGNVLSGRPIEWRTSSSALATVTAGGVVTAVAPGVVVITAVSEGRSGTATIQVRLAPVARVVVAPASAVIKRRATRQFVATLYDADGRVLTGREVSWSTSDGKIATVDRTGLVTAQKKGDATITATAEGVRGTATVQVIP
jgi:uncharacterized protein YjdB